MPWYSVNFHYQEFGKPLVIYGLWEDSAKVRPKVSFEV